MSVYGTSNVTLDCPAFNGLLSRWTAKMDRFLTIEFDTWVGRTFAVRGSGLARPNLLDIEMVLMSARLPKREDRVVRWSMVPYEKIEGITIFFKVDRW